MTDTAARIAALHAEIAYLIQFEKDRIDRENPHLNSIHRQIAHCKWEVLAQSPRWRAQITADLAYNDEQNRRQYAD